MPKTLANGTRQVSPLATQLKQEVWQTARASVEVSQPCLGFPLTACQESRPIPPSRCGISRVQNSPTGIASVTIVCARMLAVTKHRRSWPNMISGTVPSPSEFGMDTWSGGNDWALPLPTTYNTEPSASIFPTFQQRRGSNSNSSSTAPRNSWKPAKTGFIPPFTCSGGTHMQSRCSRSGQHGSAHWTAAPPRPPRLLQS